MQELQTWVKDGVMGAISGDERMEWEEYEIQRRAFCVTLPSFDTGIASDAPENGGDCPNWRLHCQDGAKPGLALHNALIGLRSLGQRVRFDDRFNFSLCYEIKGFVEIFGP